MFKLNFYYFLIFNFHYYSDFHSLTIFSNTFFTKKHFT